MIIIGRPIRLHNIVLCLAYYYVRLCNIEESIRAIFFFVPNENEM